VQPDNKVVAVGNSKTFPGKSQIVLIRLLEDGSYDPDFGTDGAVIANYGNVNSAFYAAALDENQRIVATGHGNEGDFLTARFLPDGSLDQSFGTNGIAFTDFFNDDDLANAIALQADGKIVTGGGGYNPNDQEKYGFALTRLNSDGSLDTTFGILGKVFTQIEPVDDEITSLAVQADGKLLACGYSVDGSFPKSYLVRYHPDGTLDTDFGSGGIVVDSGSNISWKFQWTGLQNDGRIVVVFSALGGDQYFGVARYLSNGTPDSTFNDTGRLILDQAIECIDLKSGLITPDGKIVIGGYSGPAPEFFVGRINPDGSIDSTFGENGFVKQQVIGTESYINSMATTPDGNLIMAGYGRPGGNTVSDFVLVKYLNDLQVGTLSFENPAQEIFVYPNPVVDHAVLRYDLKEDQLISIRLLDIAGKPIKVFVQDQIQAAGSNQQTIMLPDSLPSGLYLILISSPKGQVCIKVVK
ncbi:MAG: T9SS type A sorting domain-containing protein, partial [Saprospiraceae bacterium]|nr:T9SS type A sorting domain-containing protein [Saprospiraceae bacterium]